MKIKEGVYRWLLAGIILELILFLIGHICQIIAGSIDQCKYSILPFTLIVEFIPLPIFWSYAISMVGILAIFAGIGALIEKHKS